MKWKLMGLIGMGHCHRNLLIAQSVSLRPSQFSVIKRCRGFVIWLIPSLSVIVMELSCTCRLELLWLPSTVNLSGWKQGKKCCIHWIFIRPYCPIPSETFLWRIMEFYSTMPSLGRAPSNIIITICIMISCIAHRGNWAFDLFVVGYVRYFKKSMTNAIMSIYKAYWKTVRSYK